MKNAKFILSIKLFKIIAYWISLFTVYSAAIITTAAILGGILYPLTGILLGFDYSLYLMAQNGVADLSHLALIWAPGIAIVLCFIKAHRQKQEQRQN